MPRTLILWIVAASAAFPVYVVGQATPVAPSGPKVHIPFFANDAHDKAVSDVTPADVEVLDNKKPPQSVVEIRGASELPLRLGLIIDTSNSERLSGIYQAAVLAEPGFASRALSGVDDRLFIEQFKNVPSATQFVSKSELGAIRVNAIPGGGTALYDAVRYACDERMKKDATQSARRVIVLISDGDDNQSNVTREEAIASAQRTGVVIFAISTASDVPGDRTLKEFADQTGGIAFRDLSRSDLPNVFVTLQEQIDNMRVLSYVPAAPLQNGQRRSLELKSASGRKLKLRAPKAYYLNAATQ